jgi:hypothetical protein
MRIFLLFLFIGLAVTDDHWFVFDKYQFPGFYTPLFTLISSINNTTIQKNLSFALSTYEHSINVEINIGNSNETIKHDQQVVKLNIDRADLLYNTLNQIVFIVIRQQTKLETYVNCKLIDSYLLYSLNPDNDENSAFKVENLVESIQHFQDLTDQQIFEKFSCKHTGPIIPNHNKTNTIGRPLIRKMQQVIEKVQRRKQRSR